MGCSGCEKRRAEREALRNSPNNFASLKSEDIFIVDGLAIKKARVADWPPDRNYLLVFIPEAFTPVCSTEIGALPFWYEKFKEHNCEVIVCCTDTPHRMLDWYNQEEAFSDRKFRTFSSYQLPSNLGLIQNGRAKRASVFITTDGEIVKQEHFEKVGRSFAELHRMMYAYTQDTYCGEGWTDPSQNLIV